MSWPAPLFSSIAVALLPDVKVGAVLSTVMVRGAAGDALPAASVETAVIA